MSAANHTHAASPHAHLHQYNIDDCVKLFHNRVLLPLSITYRLGWQYYITICLLCQWVKRNYFELFLRDALLLRFCDLLL